MIEKFFEMERLFLSFLITIALVAVVEFICIKLNVVTKDEMLLILAISIFAIIKMFFANYDFYNNKKENNIKKDKNKK